jgi:hypothetical protein
MVNKRFQQGIELEKIKQELRERERERERRIMKRLVLTLNFNSDCFDNYRDNES